MLGLIQAIGLFGIAEEGVLLMELRDELERLAAESGGHVRMAERWLNSRTFRFKANLLTRLYDVDELEAELEGALYADMNNPLFDVLPYRDAIRKARLVTSGWRRERRGERCRKA